MKIAIFALLAVATMAAISVEISHKDGSTADTCDLDIKVMGAAAGELTKATPSDADVATTLLVIMGAVTTDWTATATGLSFLSTLTYTASSTSWAGVGTMQLTDFGTSAAANDDGIKDLTITAGDFDGTSAESITYSIAGVGAASFLEITGLEAAFTVEVDDDDVSTWIWRTYDEALAYAKENDLDTSDDEGAAAYEEAQAAVWEALSATSVSVYGSKADDASLTLLSAGGSTTVGITWTGVANAAASERRSLPAASTNKDGYTGCKGLNFFFHKDQLEFLKSDSLTMAGLATAFGIAAFF